MVDAEPLDILLLANSAALARHRDALAKCGRVYVDLADMPAERPIDVVVCGGLNRAAGLSPEERPLADLPGVLVIGGESPADVAQADRPQVDLCLPNDCTARELQTACRLLGEIARLRRQTAHSDVAQSDLVRMAFTDPLTQVANRRAWDEALARAVEPSARSRTADNAPAKCLAIVDLDRFKLVNDRFGHHAGDGVLKAAAAALAGLVRRGDLVARLGGDEFGLLLHELSSAEAGRVVERIRAGLCGALAQAPHPVTASAGYAPIACHAARTADNWFDAAAQALRTAKQAGRDRTVSADAAPSA